MVTVKDVAWFVAELAVYVGVGWWGATRPSPPAGRILLAVVGVTVMALSWGAFAAPEASHPLSGSASILFRVLWFGLGALALATVALPVPTLHAHVGSKTERVVVGRWRPMSPRVSVRRHLGTPIPKNDAPLRSGRMPKPGDR